jgi:DNA primase
MAPLIREIANPVERAHYTQALARLVQIDERLVAEQISVTGRIEDKERRAREEIARTEAPSVKAERRRAIGLEEHLLGCVLMRPDLLAQLDAEMIALLAPPLGPEDFAEPENRAAMGALLKATDLQPGDWDLEPVFAALPETLLAHCRALLVHAQAQPPLSDDRLFKEMGDALLRLRDRNLRQRMREVERLLTEVDDAGDADERRRYQEVMVSYSAQIGRLHRLMRARSMVGSLESKRAAEALETA